MGGAGGRIPPPPPGMLAIRLPGGRWCRWAAMPPRQARMSCPPWRCVIRCAHSRLTGCRRSASRPCRGWAGTLAARDLHTSADQRECWSASVSKPFGVATSGLGCAVRAKACLSGPVLLACSLASMRQRGSIGTADAEHDWPYRSAQDAGWLIAEALLHPTGLGAQAGIFTLSSMREDPR
jgi:hypothetical protein